MISIVQNALPLRVDDEHIPDVIPPVDTNPIPRSPKKRLQDARSHGVPEQKRCSQCNKVKPASEFTHNSQSRDLLNFRCKTCNSADHRGRYQRLTADERAHLQEKHLKRTYGLTLEQRQAMLELQGGGCAICGGDDTSSKGWHVDHDHRSGVIRGILCSGCNTALGHMRDNSDLMIAGAEYLRRYDR